MYWIESGAGDRIRSAAKTILGAKREATNWITFGGGNVYIFQDDGVPLWMRKFWQSGDRYGWDRWQKID